VPISTATIATTSRFSSTQSLRSSGRTAVITHTSAYHAASPWSSRFLVKPWRMWLVEVESIGDKLSAVSRQRHR